MTTNERTLGVGRAVGRGLWSAVLLFGLVFSSLALPGSARAQTRSEPFLGFYGIGVGVGIADPHDLSSTVCFLGRADLGTVLLGFSVLPTVEYWGKSDQVEGTKISSHDLTTGAEVRYRFGRRTARPYAGAGLALHFLSRELAVGGTVQSRDQKQRLGAVVLAGMEFRRSAAFTFFAEAKYRFVKDLDTWKALGGIVYTP